MNGRKRTLRIPIPVQPDALLPGKSVRACGLGSGSGSVNLNARI